MKKFLMKMLLIGVITVSPQLFLNAQCTDGTVCPECCNDPGGCGFPDPDEIPLDPGSWVLVAAGVGYGVKKWKDSKRNDKKGEYSIAEVHANRINEESE